MYYYEHEQKEKINGRIQVPIGFLTLLIGLAVFFINGFEDLKEGTASFIFYILFSLFIFTLVIIVFFLIKAYYNYQYKFIPSPKNLDESAQEKITYYNTYYDQHFKYSGGPSREALIQEKIDEEVYFYYRDATEINIKLNQKKLDYMRLIGYCLIASLLVGLISLVPYLKAHEKEKIQNIQIENLNELVEAIQFKKFKADELQIKQLNDLLENIEKTK